MRIAFCRSRRRRRGWPAPSPIGRAAGAKHPDFADVAIAATAKLRGFTILTRNARHFEPLGVPFLDPFAELPPHHPSAA
jgi:predicted nucleic acid-binding protein